LIDSVLDFQKLEAGKMRYDIRDNDLQKTVEDACNTMRPYAQKRGVHLHVKYEPDLPKVAFDTDRLIQVVTNLVSNAIKFTPESGRIAVSVQGRAEHVAIRVSDTGLGIPKEALPKVFERFYRVKRPGKEIKGTGLGLAIVNKIVNAHGGRIDVESEPNKGTTFTVLLPCLVKPNSDVLPKQTDEHLERTLADD
jgi:signal transduction histidine kinase